MLREFLASGTLNLVYAGTVLVSFLFVLLTLIGSEVGDAFDFDIDVDTDGGFDLMSVSPFSIAMFGAAFGVTGIITRLSFMMDTVPSLLWATGVGLIFGVVAQAFMIFVLMPTKSGHFNLASDVLEREAEVIVTIPKEGLGTIAYDNVSGRVTLGARSANGEEIRRGQFVMIERVTGRVALVWPIKNEA